MKGMNFFILASGCMLAAVLAACTSMDEPVPEQLSSPVGFSPTVNDANTRYASDDLPATMGVFASLTEGSNFNASTSTPNFMYNQLVARQADGSWTYSPVKYWPTTATDKVSFFAYAPHNTSGLTPCANTQKGYPSFTYAVAKAAIDQVDLLASAPFANKNSGEVDFTLRHVLTKVTLKIKSGDKYAKEITSLSVNAATNGELHFSDSGFEWKNVTGTYSYTPTATTDLNFAVTDKEQTVATFFLLPTATVTATYSISYKVKTAGGTDVLTRTFTTSALPATPLWTAGGHVVYTVSLSERTATVTAEVTAWQQDADNSCDVEIFYPDDLKIGDYFYSDGSWSDGGLRTHIPGTNNRQWESPFPAPVLTNPDTGSARSVIGVVFNTTPSATDKSNGWTHGYAMGLQYYSGDRAAAAWAKNSGYNTAIPDGGDEADFDGYTHCQQLMADTEWQADNTNFPAFYNTCITHNNSVPAPAATSGWYLPSAGQLASIFYNIGGGISTGGLSNIGKHMGKFNGTTVSLSLFCLYYSSNERGSDAWLVRFYGGGALVDRGFQAKIPFDGRASAGGHIPVLAF